MTQAVHDTIINVDSLFYECQCREITPQGMQITKVTSMEMLRYAQ